MHVLASKPSCTPWHVDMQAILPCPTQQGTWHTCVQHADGVGGRWLLSVALTAVCMQARLMRPWFICCKALGPKIILGGHPQAD
jgi:hypothetical protein